MMKLLVFNLFDSVDDRLRLADEGAVVRQVVAVRKVAADERLQKNDPFC